MISEMLSIKKSLGPVSIVRTAGGLIIGAKSFRNEYDGHTIDASLKQVERLTGKRPDVLAGDRGYRG